MKKNSMFKIFQNMAKMQAGKTADIRQGKVLTTLVNSSTVLLHRFDVERSFSFYKHLQNHRRHTLTYQNLERIVVANCFNTRDQ